MKRFHLASTSAVALGVTALAVAPAGAQQDQEQKAQEQKAQEQSGQQTQGQDKIDLVGWAERDLYDGGWTAEQLFGQTVYGENTEEAGEVENLVVGADGTVEGVIVESGGFLDIGDTHYRVPWDQVKLTSDLEGITVPVTADNIEQYSVFDEEEVAADQRAFRATELIGDYVSLADHRAYGVVQDLVFDQQGAVQAVVVYPDVGYGARGPYAYPWYGYDAGWEPGVETYDLPYTRSEIEELGPFDYSELPAPPPRPAGARMQQEGQPQQGEAQQG